MANDKRKMPFGFWEDALKPQAYLIEKYHCNTLQVRRWRDELGIGKHRVGKVVNQYLPDGTFVKRHASVHQAAREVGGFAENISLAANGIIKTAYGYVWRFDDGN